MTVTWKASPAVGRPAHSCIRPSGQQLFWSVAFGVSLAIGTAVFRYLTIPAGLRYFIVAFPLLFGLLYMRSMVKDTRRQIDELQLRIYLEAGAWVVGGLFIVMLLYPLLESAKMVGPLEYWAVLALMTVLGIAGYVAAARRYR